MPLELKRPDGAISSIFMRDQENGWFSYRGFLTIYSTPYAHGIFKTTDGGNTWNALDSVQYNCVSSPRNAFYVSDGGIASLNDSICIVSSDIAPVKPPSTQRAFARAQSYVTTNAGRSWDLTSLEAAAWGIYAQKSTGIFYAYPEDPYHGSTPDTSQLFYSLDTGHSWVAGSIVPHSDSAFQYPNWPHGYTTGDIEGDSDAIYLQGSLRGMGMFRSTDRGQTWDPVGGPSNTVQTRFCVIPSCDGGTVIAFDDTGGVWLTMDGGDGKLGYVRGGSVLKQDSSYRLSPCNTLTIPIPLRGSEIDTLHIQSSVLSDTFKISSFGGSNSFQLPTNETDTLWLRVAPTVSPYVDSVSIQFHNFWRCANWTDTRTFVFSDPPSAAIIAPASMIGSCSAVLDSGIFHIDSCQTLVLTNSFAEPLPSQRFLLENILPDTIRAGYHQNVSILFDPSDTILNQDVTLHLHGYYLGTSIRFDTFVTIHAIANPSQPEFVAKENTLNFGLRNSCITLPDTAVIFTNLGCAPDTITNAGLTGTGFIETGDTLPEVVAPGDSVAFHYRFVPPDTGAYAATAMLHVVSMGLTEDPQISLVGRGVQGVGVLDVHSTSLEAGSFSFCDGDTTLTDTLSNRGCDTLVISHVRFSGDSAWSSASSLLQDSLLLPNTSRVVQFYFAPRLKGLHGATLSFHSRNIANDPGHDTTITLSGIGVGGTKVLATDTSLRDFGALYECQERDTAIWLKNAGCDTLTISSGVFSSGAYASGVSYPLIIPPNDSAKVVVVVTPDTNGHPVAITGTYAVTSDADNSIAPIPLSTKVLYPSDFGVALSPPLSARDGQAVTFQVLLNGKPPTGITALHFDLTHNDDLLSYTGMSGAGLSLDQTVPQAGIVTQRFTLSPVAGRDTIGTLTFQVYLTDSSSTPLTLSNVSFDNSLDLPSDCIASVEDSGSGFTYLYRCGDQLIQDAMKHVPFTIASIVPNPARNEIRVSGIGLGGKRGNVQTVKIEVFDLLGRAENIRSESMENGFDLDVSSLRDGTYSLRIAKQGYVEIRTISILR